MENLHDDCAMSKRGKLILFAGALLALGLCVDWFSRGEPKYQGRTLSAWLDIYRNQKGDAMARFKAVTPEQLGEPPTKEQSEAADAVRQIGHKTIPTLLKWVKYRPPAWKRRLAGVLRKIEQTSFGQWRVVEKTLRSLESPDEIQIRTAGVLGLAILGEQAAPAIPELVQMTNDPDGSNRSRALGALTRLGRVGLVALQEIAANSDSPNSLLAVRYMASMKYLGTNARPVIPLLVQAASDPDPDIAREGIYTLCVLGLEPGLCFPAFTNAIGSTNTSLQVHTIHHIGYFGRAVDLRPLVPSLTNCLNSPNRGVRSKAIDMLTHIAPEATLRSPVVEIRLAANNEVALKGTSSPSEVEPLVRTCLLDSDPEVRRAATNALEQVLRDTARLASQGKSPP